MNWQQRLVPLQHSQKIHLGRPWSTGLTRGDYTELAGCIMVTSSGLTNATVAAVNNKEAETDLRHKPVTCVHCADDHRRTDTHH